MKIHESAENYLEAIHILTKEKGSVRSIDVAHYLSFSKPSISVAMKRLREQSYIDIDHSGNLRLTETGLRIAEEMFDRHTTLTRFFAALGVSEKTAEDDACKIEHQISTETYQKLKAHCVELTKKAF